ncbi:MAG: sugar ABC transporter permease [Clostridia bacterium]|nr:sugar ABC transporter permease [Clostridia bacterium]
MQRTVSPSYRQRGSLWTRIKRYKYIYLLLLPVVLYYLIFHYATMAGLVIAFQNYKPRLGFSGSQFVGLKHFKSFLSGVYAGRLIRNTLLINLLQMCFGFPAPILLALLFNEMRENAYKKTLQTISYMPHFIAMVVLCGMLREFSMTGGLFNDIAAFFGAERINYLSDPKYYRTIYVGSGIWQNCGWGSIIYLAALSGVDHSLHEAAAIDGAGRIRRIIHVNLPAIVPIIVVQLIMRVGNIMSQGYEKTILLYSSATYEVADIISSYVYRRGLEMQEYSFGAAVGIFNSIVNLAVLTIANYISRRVSENSLW